MSDFSQPKSRVRDHVRLTLIDQGTEMVPGRQPVRRLSALIALRTDRTSYESLLDRVDIRNSVRHFKDVLHFHTLH